MSFPAVDPPAESAHRATLGDRRLFPDLAAAAYLNHAAISPPSLAVREAVQRALTDYATRGTTAFMTWHAQRLRLKGRLARLLGGEPHELALVPNTTAGLNLVAQCYPWTRGDRVLLFRGEFPTNVTPWVQAAETFGLDVEFLDVAALGRPEGPDFDPLERALATPTRMVAISAVQFQTGLRVPLAEVAARCRAAGAELCVDGIQAVGATPVALADCDYLAVGGHKWLMGVEGAGFLWARADRAERLVPRVAGWLSHRDAADFLFDGPGKMRYDKPLKTTLDFVEGGAPNTIGYAALEASVGLIEQIGVAAIHAHVNRYHDALEPLLVALGLKSARLDPARRSTLLSFTPPAGVEVGPLVARLAQHGVAASSPDGYVRFAPHWPNGMAEVSHVVEAMERALDEG